MTRKKSLYMFSTYAPIIGLTTLAHISKNVRFFPNIFNLRSVESTDMGPEDMEGRLYVHDIVI